MNEIWQPPSTHGRRVNYIISADVKMSSYVQKQVNPYLYYYMLCENNYVCKRQPNDTMA